MGGIVGFEAGADVGGCGGFCVIVGVDVFLIGDA